jgi:hypothetical protein
MSRIKEGIFLSYNSYRHINIRQKGRRINNIIHPSNLVKKNIRLYRSGQYCVIQAKDNARKSIKLLL